MTPRASLLQLAKLVAKDLVSGFPSGGTRDVGAALSGNPEAVLIVVDLLIAETGKKRPSDKLVAALLFMLRQALNETRMRSESRPSDEPGLIEQLRSQLSAAAAADRLAPELLMMVAQEFAAAKLDIGDALRATMVDLAERMARKGNPEIEGGGVAAPFEELAVTLDHDPFLIHAQLSQSLSIYPDEQRIAIIGTLVDSDVAAMHDACLGWLLDPNEKVALAVAEQLAKAAAEGGVSALGANRMLAMRDWVSEEVRGPLDAAVRVCRQRGAGAVPDSALQVSAVIASGCDGAGAQTFFVIAKRGRKLALASLLVKHDFGVRDAYVQDRMSRRDVEAVLNEIMRELDPFEASLDIVRAAIQHHLAVGQDLGSPPPFGLLQVAEAIGLTALHPARVSDEALMARLLDDLPIERRSEAAVATALKLSKRWPDRYVCLQSWFEDIDPATSGLPAAKTKKQREDIILDHLLPERRARWASLLAWTAAAAQHVDDEDGWIDLALVARELFGARLLRDIPLARWIAENTVRAVRAG